MNKGLNKKSTFQTYQVKKAGIININLCKNEGGVFVTIPLFNTPGINSKTYTLTYSSFEKVLQLKESTFKTFTKLSEKEIIVKDSFGEEVKYELELEINDEKRYYNSERRIYLIEELDSIYLEDKVGNKVRYQKNKTYPNLIIENGIEKLKRTTDLRYDNFFGTEIEFIKDSNEINFYKNNQQIYKIKFEYLDENSFNIIHYRCIYQEESNITVVFELYKNEYTFTTNLIKIKDGYSKYYIEVIGEMVDGTFYPSTIKEGINQHEINQTSIIYTPTYTKIVNQNPYYLNYHFDNNNNLRKIVNEKGHVILYEYDERRNLITKTKPLFNDYITSSKKGIIIDYFNTSNILGWSLGEVVSDTTQYSETYGRWTLELKNESTIFQTSYKIVNYEGKKDTFLSLRMWSRRVSGNSDLTVKVTLENEKTTSIYEFKTNNLEFDIDVFEIKAQNKYNKIKLELITPPHTNYHINAIYLEQTYSKTYFEYDFYNNVTSIKKGKQINEYHYNEDGKLDGIINLDNFIKYNKDQKGYILSTVLPTSAVSKIKYDENYHPITYQLVTTNQYLENKKEYQNDFIIKTVDDNNSETTLDINKYSGLINSVTRKINQTPITTNYEYDIHQNLIKQTQNNQVLEYTKTPNQEEVYLNNTLGYKYYYDDYCRPFKITLKEKLTNKEIDLLEYEYQTINNSPTTNILRIKQFNNNIYHYEYDTNQINRINKIYYVEELGGEKELCNYEYDSLGNIISITNDKGKENYQYDIDNKIIKYQKDNDLIETYQYNDLDQLVHLKRTINNLDENYIYETFTTKTNLNNIYNDYYQLEKTFITFHDDLKNEEETTIKLWYKKDNDLKEVKGKIQGKVNLKLENRTHTIELNKSEETTIPSGIEFNLLETINIAEQENRLTFSIWFNPKSYTNQYLVSFGNYYSENNLIHIIPTPSGRIQIIIKDNQGIEHIINTNNHFNSGMWNYLGLILEIDGNNLKMTIILNKNKETVTISSSYTMLMSIQFMMVGYQAYRGSIIRYFEGEIGAILLSIGKEYQEEELTNYYYKTLKYIYTKEALTTKNRIYSSTTKLEHQKVLDSGSTGPDQIYPLNQTLNSLNGTPPLEYVRNENLKYDRYKIYKYDDELKHSTYHANGSKLIYQTNASTIGLVSMKIKIEETATSQAILEIYQDTSRRILLSRGYNNQIDVSVHNKTTCSNLQVINDTWTEITLSWYTSQTKTNIKLKVNEKEYLTSSEGQFNTNCKVMIGTNNDGNFPLLGLISNLIINNGYFFTSGIIQGSYLKEKTYQKEYNELNQLTKTSIIQDSITNKNKYEVSYKYQELEKTGNYQRITNQIIAETHQFKDNNDIIYYSYDTLGRVISKDTFRNGTQIRCEAYSYSFDNKLTYFVDLLTQEETKYEYDNLGNIIKKTISDLYDTTNQKITNYTYNNLNELIKINDQEIKYDNKMNPVEIGTNNKINITWDNQFLTKYQNNLTLDEYYYEYNLLTGQRTKKIKGNIETTYYYQNNKLIYEKEGNNYRKYIYDENNNLVELEAKINNQIYQLIYQKDILGNIIGLIDTNNELVIGYEYSPFGEVSINQNTLNIPALDVNPILYKGYYYDKETQLFWVSSRYYSPELCRWISPDSIEYLDLESINGLNLYAYCGNDPINRFDPTGHSWKSFWNGVGDWFEEHWVEVAVGTAFIVGGAVVTALTCGAGTTAWAAFGSALLSSAIQVGASVGVGVVANGVSNLVQGNEFFDNVGDTIASSYMLGGILSGGSQMLSGGFRFLRAKAGFKGIDTKNFGFMSPDKLFYDKPGMTVLRLGSRNGAKLSLDFGKYGIHGHIWKWATHFPLIPGIVGVSEFF